MLCENFESEHLNNNYVPETSAFPVQVQREKPKGFLVSSSTILRGSSIFVEVGSFHDTIAEKYFKIIQHRHNF